jgi:hypothetical protein
LSLRVHNEHFCPPQGAFCGAPRDGHRFRGATPADAAHRLTTVPGFARHRMGRAMELAHQSPRFCFRCWCGDRHLLELHQRPCWRAVGSSSNKTTAYSRWSATNHIRQREHPSRPGKQQSRPTIARLSTAMLPVLRLQNESRLCSISGKRLQRKEHRIQEGFVELPFGLVEWREKKSVVIPRAC